MLPEVVGPVERKVCAQWVQFAVKKAPELEPIVRRRVPELCGEIKVELGHKHLVED